MRKTAGALTGKVVDMAPGLRRILAPNPSAMTHTGTNTYLLGTRDLAVIDPGPPDDAHLEAILGALQQNQRISHIFVTHSHIDHSPLAMVLAQISGAKVHAFGDSKAGRASVMDSLGDLGGGEGIDESFMPDIALRDGDEIAGSNWSLRAHHTPGHMGNHLCFEWLEEPILFSGDHVMGWASSMVSPPDGDLTRFMASLDKLAELDWPTRYMPGHGEPIETPKDRLRALREHRLMRESQILQALKNGPLNAEGLARKIYTDVNPALLPAATRNVLAHLIDLQVKSQVSSEGLLAADSLFRLS